MKKNMGLSDQIIRVALALISPILYFTGVISGVFAIILFCITGILLVTSFIKFCPLYSLFGMHTDKK